MFRLSDIARRIQTTKPGRAVLTYRYASFAFGLSDNATLDSVLNTRRTDGQSVVIPP
jgi:hypothetical protein